MTLTISSDFENRNISLSLAMIKAEVCVRPSEDNLLDLLDQTAQERLVFFNGQPASVDPQIMAARKAYKALGKDPARYRPAAEALTRRVLQGKGLYHVNNLVDINNLVSIKSGLSIGTYQCDQIQGDIVFRRADSTETYKGIGRDMLNLEGLPVFCDKLGPFGSPTSDSERTMITPGNHNIIMVLICFGPPDHLKMLQNETAQLLTHHCDAKNITFSIVSNG